MELTFSGFVVLSNIISTCVGLCSKIKCFGDIAMQKTHKDVLGLRKKKERSRATVGHRQSRQMAPPASDKNPWAPSYVTQPVLSIIKSNLTTPVL